MKRREKLATKSEWFYSLLTTVVDEINEATGALSEAEVQRRGIEHRRAEKKLREAEALTDEPTSLGAFFKLGPNEAELEMWREYHVAERARIANLFRELAVKGRLPRFDLEEQFATAKRGMSYVLHAEIRDGRPIVEPRMVFDQTHDTLEAKLAMVLLTLAEGNGPEVLQCAHRNCKRLFIRWPEDRGPRPEACHDHISAYRQARHRRIAAERAAKLAAAKKRRAVKYK